MCALCPRKGTDEDLVDGGPMKWGLRTRGGKPTGKVCYYCRRVWRANYSASFSLEKFIPQCAQNKSTFDTFSSLVSFAIHKMVTAGSHDVTIRKSDLDATAEESVLSQIRRTSVICDSADEIWTVAEYVVNFGDPLHNGKGHERIHHEGSDCVLIPGGKRKSGTPRAARPLGGRLDIVRR